MMLRRRNLMAQKTGYSLDSYVHDSTIIWLDGIENTRKGHNAEAAEWEDLSGPYSFTKTSNFSFGDSHILATGKIESKYGVKVPAEYTLEIVYQYTGSTNYGIGLMEIAPMFRGRKSTVSWWARRKPDSSDESRLYYDRTFDINALNSVAITQNAGGGKSYCNGVMGKKNANVYTNNNYQKFCNYTESEVMTGKIYAIRLHSRALTDAELAHNFAVDKQRFGIKEVS